MDPNTSELERAFELAKSGRFRSLEQIRSQLKKEGYSSERITGKLLIGQLKEIMRSASAPPRD